MDILDNIKNKKETVWINENKKEFRNDYYPSLSMDDIIDAKNRLERFAPFIKAVFPETEKDNGVIESELTLIDNMKKCINEKYGADIKGTLYLKQDNALKIAGSVKARGGIYEVLKHTEKLAIENNLLSSEQSYARLKDEDRRKFFGKYTIQVGSTGNLGMSIGIIGAAIGYNVIVHMSADAKKWKKDLLRSKGVTVIEYDTDYSEAVNQGRIQSDNDPMSYFVDDENSKDLFLGYSVAALRLKKQLADKNIKVDKDNPLIVYIPCGIGGAPGGITYGLKQVFGDNAHCFFVEPVNAPCMVLGMVTGLNSKISVQDVGLDGLTQADGLAVGRPSGFVGDVMKEILSGIFTVSDERLNEYLRDLISSEGIFLEPSACSAFIGPVNFSNCCKEYIKNNNLEDKLENITHIAWATGGSLVPENVRKEYLEN